MPRLPDLAAAAALLFVTASSWAQVGMPPPTPVAVRTLVTPSLIGGSHHHCNVTNHSSHAAPLMRLDLYGAGQVLASATCAGGTSSLAPGGSCMVTWALSTSSTWGIPVHCRAQHGGAEAALVGSLQNFRFVNGGSRAVASAPMQLVTGVALAP